MAEENKNKQNQEQEQEMDDIEMAELANKELRKRDEEISRLKKELAKAKLYSQEEETEEPTMSKEECLKVIGDSKTSNYDYAKAVVELCNRCEEEGKPNPLGDDGERVKDFFNECIEDCNGVKGKFTAVYQAKIGEDKTQNGIRRK